MRRFSLDVRVQMKAVVAEWGWLGLSAEGAVHQPGDVVALKKQVEQ
jgi:hypothetical protein